MRVCDVDGEREGVVTLQLVDAEASEWHGPPVDLCAECMAAMRSEGVVRAIRERGKNRTLPPPPA